MKILLNGDIQCIDGFAGRLICVIVNPLSQQLTHIVVDEKRPPYLKRLVPLDLVSVGNSDGVTLDCTLVQLSALRPVVEFEYPQGNGLHTLFAAKSARQWPQNVSDNLSVSVELERLAPETIKIHRDNSVRAMNGRVGKVVEFLVNPATKKIIALTIRRKSWWKTIETRVPIFQVDHFELDLVLLKSDKRELQSITTGQWQKRNI
jgi:hypothetical protein